MTSIPPGSSFATVHVPKPKYGLFERVRRYLSGADLDEAEDAVERHRTAAGSSAVPNAPSSAPLLARLPFPLPHSVHAVAVAQLVTNGIVVATSAIFLAGGAVMVVVMPFWMGREGVGLSMITMFGIPVLALMALPPLFGVRAAARILRRDPRGVPSLYRWAMFSLVLTSVGSAVAVAALVASSAVLSSGFAGVFSIVRSTLGAATGVAFSLWSVLVLRRYKRELAEQEALEQEIRP